MHSDVLQHEQALADDEVAAALEVAPGTPVVVLERLRHVDGEPWSLSTTWMPEAVGGVTLGVDLSEASLYRLLAENGIVATSGVRSAEATVATHEQAQHLGVSAGSALLRLRSVSRGADGIPIEYFVAHHRGDRSRFVYRSDCLAAGSNHDRVESDTRKSSTFAEKSNDRTSVSRPRTVSVPATRMTACPILPKRELRTWYTSSSPWGKGSRSGGGPVRSAAGCAAVSATRAIRVR